MNTRSLTHLELAFANINPSMFAVVPADLADEARYTQFTELKAATLQTGSTLAAGPSTD